MAVDAAAASSSNFVPSLYKYDVFISFRGEDTRKNFTSHLYAELRRHAIEIYMDEESLERGDEISPALLKAIEESQLSLVVFSNDYASSRWCLDELVHILKCKKERGQIVVPVFYHIDPSDIRHQMGNYGAAFVTHQKRYKHHDRSKVEAWRNALKEAAALSGFDLQNQSESKFVENIVRNILQKLEALSSSAATANEFKGLVGMNKRLEKMESLLCVGSPDVRIVGIWGMGGIGKTTLAEALYTRFNSKFEGCFFTNAKEDVNKCGLNSLKEKLFCKLLKRESVNMESSFKDVQLRRKRVLVVLDNVDELEQLECLLGEEADYEQARGWFGVGSRVIITSRDKKLLMRIAVGIYEVEALDYDEAQSLFYQKAFKRGSSEAGYTDLAERVLYYAKGNPLALKVLGSHLHSRSREEWQSTLSKLNKSPDEKILRVLKMSYDALDRTEKSIFLDIACFLKGENRDFVEGILDKESHIGISILIEKSLITIEHHGIIGMHDLIQEMGWEIVRQESHNELSQRSRLWIAQDVFQVLEYNKGTKSIEGISLDMSEIDEDLCLEPAVFEAMSHLRLLKIYDNPYHNTGPKCKVHLRRGLRYLPNSLRYLSWWSYPLKTLPSKFRPESLVEIDMSFSQLNQLWDGVQPLRNLKNIDFSYSEQLAKIPDLSHVTGLRSISLEGCKNLVEVPPLNFKNSDVPKYTEDDEGFYYTGPPELLNLSRCTNLKSLPEISGGIRILKLRESGIKELPSSIRSCENLHDLDLRGCKNLESVSELPTNIRRLNLSGTPIRELPTTSIECLHVVEEIDMSDCKRLESIPSNFCKLKALIELELSGCSNLKNLPDILEPMENLGSLNLFRAGIQELPSSFENLIGLKKLRVDWCENLKTIPNCLSRLRCFDERLFLFGCRKLESFPDMLLGLHSIKEVDLSYCNIYEIPDWIGSLSTLTKLCLKGNMFASIPSSIKQLSRLFHLNISHCTSLQSLPELPSSIYGLDAVGCMSMETVLTSGPTLTLRHWMYWKDCYDPTNVVNFLFCECLKLDRSAWNNTVVDFLCRVASTAMIPKLVAEQKEIFPRIEVCHPGNRIPKWIKHQSEMGSSIITIKLPPNWHASNFSGFVLCVVLSLEGFHGSHVDINCELHLKTKYGQSHWCVPFSWVFNTLSFPPGDSEDKKEILRSDHVFMWYQYYKDSLNKCDDAVEMSFDFYCKNPNPFQRTRECSYKYEMKRCGVLMFYNEEKLIKKYDLRIKEYVECMVEAGELGISIHQYMRSLQGASHNVVEGACSDDNDDNMNAAGPSHEYSTSSIHEEAGFQTNINIVEVESEAIINEPDQPRAIGRINESCPADQGINCFDFCRCSTSFLSKFLDWIQGNGGN